MKTETQRSYVLVVVDMQVGFRASLDEATINAVEAEIKTAIAGNQPIVILEFAKYPKTHERLMKLLDGYSRFAVETKLNEDGSEEVIEACIGSEFPGGAFRFCGVNTHCCVQQTVTGLASRLDESVVELVKAACNDDETPGAWSKFVRLPNVHLV